MHRSILALAVSAPLMAACAHRQLAVYPLSYEDAAAAAEVIDALATRGSGVHAAVPVERTNIIVVDATPTGHQAVSDLLLNLDVDMSDGSGPKVLVVYLEEHRAEELAPVLRGLWPDDAVRIEVDERANALVLRAEPEALRGIQGVVGKLDLSEEHLAAPVRGEVEAVELGGD